MPGKFLVEVLARHIVSISLEQSVRLKFLPFFSSEIFAVQFSLNIFENFCTSTYPGRIFSIGNFTDQCIRFGNTKNEKRDKRYSTFQDA